MRARFNNSARFALTLLLAWTVAVSHSILAADSDRTMLAYAGSPAHAATASRQLMTLADLGREVQLGDLAISADGKHIALTVARADYVDNRFVKSLVIIETATGSFREPVPNRQDVSAPQWSPSGEALAYLDTEKGGAAQIYVLRVIRASGGAAARQNGTAAAGKQTDATAARRVTGAPRGVQAFRWSPDGASLAYLTPDAPEVRTGDEAHNKSFNAGEGDYLTTAPPAPSQLWVIASSDGEARQVTSGKESLVDIAWLADNRRVAFISQPSAYFSSFSRKSLSTIDTVTGERKVLVAGPTAFDHASSFALSPDGSVLSFQYYPGPEILFHPTQLAVVPVSGGERRIVAPSLDRTVLSHAWSAGPQSLVTMHVDRTRTVGSVQRLDGSVRSLDLGRITSVASLVSNKSGALALIASEPRSPPEVYYLASIKHKPKRLTSFNEHLARLETGRVETLIWKGPDGFTLDGVITHPPGAAARRVDSQRPAGATQRGAAPQKAPLVLNLHGGPMFATPEAWDGFSQLLAAQGWTVFQPNYRGSTSTGNALQAAIINDAGDGPGRDVMSGIEVLKSRGLVDETRMAVSGWSYGGYMTAWLIGHYPVWRAAVTGATVTDWFDYYNTSDVNVWAGAGLGGSPWIGDNAERYWRQSPIAWSRNARTPTLILANTGDRRVTISQSYKLYHALKDNGVEVEFIAYPVDAHVPVDPVHERDIRRRWIDWIARHFDAPGRADANHQP